MGRTNDITSIKETKAIAPHNTNYIALDGKGQPVIFRALWVGGSGHVSYQDASGKTGILKNPAVGIWHPLAFTKILANNTTATDLVAGI